MGAERRIAERKSVDSVAIADLTLAENYQLLARHGLIIDASTSGFLMLISRRDLLDKELRSNLNLDTLIGKQVVLFLPQMNLDLDGVIKRTAHTGQGFFEIAVQFSKDVPEYWRECLIDLLPGPGEIRAE